MKKILIVEDNPANMKLFSDLLEIQNYSISKEIDGESGLKRILSEDFDLLILDIQLPKLNGFEIIKQAGSKLPKTIIVSAFAMEHEINLAKTYGIENYITKPIDVIKFTNMVKGVIDKED